MNIDLKNIIEKGTRFAEQATSEDNAHDYELAAQAYIAASDCFVHATKYGIIDEEMKENMLARVVNYMKRAEEIKNIIGNAGTKKQKLADDTTDCKSLKGEPSDEDINEINTNNYYMDLMTRSIVTDSKVTYDDVIGLAYAKTALLETVILPVKFPKLFQDECKSSTSVLLYGSVGSGKTYFAKSIAAECKVTFISMNAWEFQSKYLYNSEKFISILFKLARERQPCILFIDDIDGLSEKDNNTESGLFHRIKSELLVQMEGIRTNNTGVFLLAAVTKPWALDSAIRQRFQKRIYIPLPGLHERVDMFKMHLDSNINHTINEYEWMQLAEKTENCSAADIAVICREALFRPLRQLMSATHFKRVNSEQVSNPKPDSPRQLWSVCSSDDSNAELITIDKIEPNELDVPPVTMLDMLAAIDTFKPTSNETDLIKYRQFDEENS